MEITCLSQCVSKDGYVKIPEALLHKFNIAPGDELSIATVRNGIVFLKKEGN